jgi:activator of HSP90 ATPase
MMKTKTIKQTVTFPTTPDKLYALLFDSKRLTKMHGAKTIMSKRPKGRFSSYDGYCTGYNVELVENQKIEQAWHFREEGWPDDHYSVCTFTLTPTTKGTKLVLLQKGVPEHKYEALKQGWKTYYWFPILQHLLQ